LIISTTNLNRRIFTLFLGFASLNPHYKITLTATLGGLKSISDKTTKAAKSVIIRNNFGSSVRRIKG